MNKLFDRIFWHNNTTPALNESNLNAMSKGIDDIDNRVVDLAGDIMETIPQLEEDLETAQELIDDLEDLNEHTPYIGANGNWWVWNTTTKEYEDSGVDASISVQIADITMLAPSATPYVTNSGTSTDPIFHLFIPRGHGVSSVTKTSTSGLVDTYTMTFTDGSTTTFTVTNGADGEDGKTAYESAVDGGYTGTESEFNAELADLPSYATNAAQSASNASASASAASGSASSASTSASDAEDSAEDSEAWAVGQRGGVDVPPTDPTYHNNAKYWSEQSAGQSLEGLTDVNISSPTNNQALKYDSVSGKWVNGDAASAISNLTDVSLSNLSNGQSLKYNSTSQKWENGTVGDMTVKDYAKNAFQNVVERSMATQLLTGNYDELVLVGHESIYKYETLFNYNFVFPGNSYSLSDTLVCLTNSVVNTEYSLVDMRGYDVKYTNTNDEEITISTSSTEPEYIISQHVPSDCDVTKPITFVAYELPGPVTGLDMLKYKCSSSSLHMYDQHYEVKFFMKSDGTLGYYDFYNREFKTTGSGGGGGNPILPINPTDPTYKSTPGAIWIET